LNEKFRGRRPVGRPRLRWEDIDADWSYTSGELLWTR